MILTHKRVLSMILIFAVLVCANPFSLNASNTNYQVHSIKFCADESIDLSNIEVMLKKVTYTTQHTNALISYEVEDYMILTSNELGEIEFSTPNCDLVINVNLDTLPNGYGVKKQSIYCGTDSASTQIELFAIDNVVPTFIYDELNFSFYDRFGDSLIVAYDILNEPQATSISETIMGKDYVTFSYKGSIVASGEEYDFDYIKEVSTENKLEYLNFLKYAEFISEDEWLTQYSKLMISEERHKYLTSEFFDKFNFYQSKLDQNSALYNNVTTALAVNSTLDETYIDYATATYLDSDDTTRRVKVYYATSTYEAIAEQYATEAASILNYFCNQYGFRAPQSPANIGNVANPNLDYVIFISDEYARGNAVTIAGAGSRLSYVKVGPNDHNRCQGVLGHELQHSIQLTYDWSGENDVWIKNMCANWASAIYTSYKGTISSYYSDWHTGMYQYLQTPNYGIDDYPTTAPNAGLRYYSLLFPLYISQAMGGIGTIENIYEEISSIREDKTSYRYYSNDNIWSAIDSVAQSTYIAGNYRSLRYILENFGRQNYNGAKSYNLFRNVSSYSDLVIDNIALSRSSANSTLIQSTGYGYFKLTSSPDEVTIDITADCSNPSNITCYIIEGYNTQNVAKTTKIQLDSATTLLNYSFESALGTDLCIIFCNTSTTEEVTISVQVN